MADTDRDLTEGMSEEEVSASRASRPSTDTNIVIQLLVGIVGAVIVIFGVIPFKGTKLKYLYGIIRERGPVQYMELFMAFMVLAFIIMKSRIIRAQLSVIAEGPVDPNADLNDDEQIQDMRNSFVNSDEFGWSIVLNRLDRMLALWLGSKDISRVSTWASDESDRDSAAFDSTYSTVRVLIWAIPIMGFIGTVMGLGGAISGFGDFLSGSAELSAIKDAIGQVTMGLGVAFDTTLLALVLSVLLMFPLSSVQRREENLFVEIDNYLDDALVSHLPSPEQQPIVIENLEDSIEAAFRRYIPDPDRYDEVFTRSIERAAETVEERFVNLSKSYETTLAELTGQISSSVANVGDTMEQSLQKVIGDLHGHEEELMTRRKDAAAEEVKQFKALMDEVYAAGEKLSASYSENVEALREAAEKSSSQSLEAAEKIAARMTELNAMAGGIQDLLRIEQSLEKSLQGIASTEEFQKTLSQLREHLATTDAFCTKLSKPRVIMLREEIAES
jgi:biopolymer transport protein ExbB/TolQ/uncharacterized protein YoxC